MTTHTDLICKRMEWEAERAAKLDVRVVDLEQQVAALTKERDHYKALWMEFEDSEEGQELAAAQAREAKLRKTISDEATAIAFYGDQPPQWMLDLIALPADDSALMERLLCFADSWRVAIEAESEACKTACVDFSYHFPAGSRERDVLQRMAVRLDMRSNAKAVGLNAAGGQSRTSDGLCPGASSENCNAHD